MAKQVQGARFIHKYTNSSGVIPTIPSNNDHTTGWLDTDIYKGELFFNIEDNRAWTRTDNGISEIPMYEGNEINLKGNVKLTGIPSGTASNILYYDDTTGNITYGVSGGSNIVTTNTNQTITATKTFSSNYTVFGVINNRFAIGVDYEQGSGLGLYHISTQNMVVGYDNNDDVATYGNGGIKINGSGNIGIGGLPNSTYSLSVEGDVYLTKKFFQNFQDEEDNMFRIVDNPNGSDVIRYDNSSSGILTLTEFDGIVRVGNPSSTDKFNVQGTSIFDGNVGINQVSPTERLDINGRIRLRTNSTTTGNDGTLRFDGSDLLGRVGGSWVSLTAGQGNIDLGITPSGTQIEITNTGGNNATLFGADIGFAGLVTTGEQTFSGRKTFIGNSIFGEGVYNVGVGFDILGGDMGITDIENETIIGASLGDNYLYGVDYWDQNTGIFVSKSGGDVGIKKVPDSSYALDVNGGINATNYSAGGISGFDGDIVLTIEGMKIIVTRGIITGYESI